MNPLSRSCLRRRRLHNIRATHCDEIGTVPAREVERLPPPPIEASDLEVLLLERMLTELHTLWTARLNEPGVTWKLRRMKTLWGVCHFSKRQITYAQQLALKPRELVEYVVVHELTHLKVHNHGSAFKALMDARLPNWRQLRRRLNGTSGNTTQV